MSASPFPPDPQQGLPPPGAGAPQQGPQSPPQPPQGPSANTGGPSAMGGPQPPQQPAPQPKAPQGPPQPPTEVTIDQVMALMRDDKMRGFRIDIETDSTVAADENEYKQRLGEFITAVGTFVEKVVPMVETHPELAPFAGETLLTITRGYRAGRQLEGAIEDAVATIEERAQQPHQGRMDPTLAAAQLQASSRLQIEQIKQQGETERHSQKLQIEQEKTAREHDRETMRLQMEQQKHAVEMDPEMLALEKAKAQAELHFQSQDHQLRAQDQQHRMGMERDKFGFEQQNAQTAQGMDERRFGAEQENAERQAGMDDQRFGLEQQTAQAQQPPDIGQIVGQLAQQLQSFAALQQETAAKVDEIAAALQGGPPAAQQPQF